MFTFQSKNTYTLYMHSVTVFWMVIHNLYFSPSIISILKSRMIEWKLHAAHIGMTWAWIPAGEKYLCSKMWRLSLWATLPPTQWAPGTLFPGECGRCGRLSTYLTLVPRLRMSSAIPAFPCMLSKREQGGQFILKLLLGIKTIYLLSVFT